jgi:hypothetical protein
MIGPGSRGPNLCTARQDLILDAVGQLRVRRRREISQPSGSLLNRVHSQPTLMVP